MSMLVEGDPREGSLLVDTAKQVFASVVPDKAS